MTRSFLLALFLFCFLLCFLVLLSHLSCISLWFGSFRLHFFLLFILVLFNFLGMMFFLLLLFLVFFMFFISLFFCLNFLLHLSIFLLVFIRHHLFFFLHIFILFFNFLLLGFFMMLFLFIVFLLNWIVFIQLRIDTDLLLDLQERWIVKLLLLFFKRLNFVFYWSHCLFNLLNLFKDLLLVLIFFGRYTLLLDSWLRLEVRLLLLLHLLLNWHHHWCGTLDSLRIYHQSTWTLLTIHGP